MFVLLASSAVASDPWAAPASYYAAVDPQGATPLKTQLYDAIRAGHTQASYGDYRSNAALIDRDPNNASNIILVYNLASIPSGWTSGSTWNREHVWPQSLQPGSASNSSRGNLGDPHALKPCNPGINSSRSNKPFAYGSTVGSYGSQGAYYFPGDSDKGDIARSLMYSETRYGPENGIALVNGFPSGNQMGDLASLIAWHYLDPPDEFERRRNHLIYSAAENPGFATNNRNPYVDRPEYVWAVYVDQSNDSSLSVGGQPAPDGSSNVVLDFGDVIAGAQPPQQAVTLTKTGLDGTYYGVAATPGIADPTDGASGAFPVLTSGSDSRSIDVALTTGAVAAAGPVVESVTIDNLDVTTGAGAGMGGLDGDDVIDVLADVYDGAVASFDSGAPTATLEIDFGAVPLGSGDRSIEFTIWNLEATPGFTAPLDLEAGTASGDTGALGSGFAPVEALTPGAGAVFEATLDTASAGVFLATYEFRQFDDRTFTGSAEGPALSLTLLATVEVLCVADIDGDGSTLLSDFAIFSGNFGSTVPPNTGGDYNGDGDVALADFGVLAADFGCTAP